MQYIRSHFLSRWLCLVVALTIFNISVDAPDPYADSVPENLAYNDIENVVEWLLEEVLNIENAIPEHDDADDGHPLKIEKSVEMFCLTHHQLTLSTPPLFSLHEKNYSVLNPATQSMPDKLIQPPKA